MKKHFFETQVDARRFMAELDARRVAYKLLP